MQYEKYQFSSDFQDLLLGCIIAEPGKFMHNVGTLNSAYFTGTSRVATARALFAYWRKNGRFPNRDAVVQIVYDAIRRSTDTKETRDEDAILAYAKKVTSVETGDVNYIAEKVVEFARERALFIAIEKSFEYQQRGEIPPGGFTKMFEDALKVGLNLEDMGYRIEKNSPDFEKILNKVTDRNYGTPTGFGNLDQLWPTGWGPGWLISILAPPKRYKTAFCINLAMNMIHATGAPVFYYPCEITQELAALRCMSHLAELPINVIYNNQRESFLNKVNLASDNLNSTLLIKGYPARSATISGDIRGHALTAKAKFGVNPKAIIIDFAETVKTNSDKKVSEYRAQGEIYTDARALGAEFQCPVIMPDRCNKETVGHQVPSMKSFQGSFEKAGIVDVAIGLCASDEEYQENVVRYFVFLNRHGMAFQHFRGRIRPDTMTMSILEKVDWKPEDDDGDERPFRQKRRRAPVDIVGA